ncbi:antitoxin [Streptomyces sp. TR06-5]|uniref:antitoxin n=1 Tax=unclassified Streptomyces TaxID=2593676 RepID=UPI0039A1DC08
MMKRLRTLVRGHEDKAAKGIDMAGRMIDRRTHGKYRRHVEGARRKLTKELTRREGGRPSSPGDPRR